MSHRSTEPENSGWDPHHDMYSLYHNDLYGFYAKNDAEKTSYENVTLINVTPQKGQIKNDKLWLSSYNFFVNHRLGFATIPFM